MSHVVSPLFPAIVVRLTWAYSPPEFLVGAPPIQFPDFPDVEFSVGDGRATATMAAVVFDGTLGLQDGLETRVRAALDARLLVRHQPYLLLPPSVSRIRPDGTGDVTLQLTGVQATTALGKLGTQAPGPATGGVADSRRDELDEERRLASLLALVVPTDRLAGSLLASYRSSTEDAGNEFVYLYEVRDLLKSQFRSESAAWAALGTRARDDWDALGKLCNAPSFRQSRHRGGALVCERHDAEAAELARARNHARGLIVAYLEWSQASRMAADGGSKLVSKHGPNVSGHLPGEGR